jgi:hypothetical protein
MRYPVHHPGYQILGNREMLPCLGQFGRIQQPVLLITPLLAPAQDRVRLQAVTDELE